MNDQERESTDHGHDAAGLLKVNSTAQGNHFDVNKNVENGNPSGADIQEDLSYFTSSDPRNTEDDQSEDRLVARTDESQDKFTSSSKLTAPSVENAVGPDHGHYQPSSSSTIPSQSSVHQSAAAVPINSAVLPVENTSLYNALQHTFFADNSSASGSVVNNAVGSSTSALVALQPILHDGDKPKPRCFEENFAVIVQRSTSAASKSSNTTYRCKFCNFTFVGGPQKIRVHLTGKRENGTRLSRCEHCPEDVRKQLEEKMRKPRETGNDTDAIGGPDTSIPSLARRNDEEYHCIVLSRSDNSNSKSSNTRYKCIYCPFRFVGGPQKIRVHITGLPEGGTRIAKCPRAPADAIAQMTHRRRKTLGTNPPAGSAQAETTLTSLTAPQATSSAGSRATGKPPVEPLLSHLQTQQNLLQQSIQKQQQLHQSQVEAQQFHSIQQHQQHLAHYQRQQQQHHMLYPPLTQHDLQQLQLHQHLQLLQHQHQQHQHYQQQQQQQQQQHLQHQLNTMYAPSGLQASHGENIYTQGLALPLPAHLQPQSSSAAAAAAAMHTAQLMMQHQQLQHQQQHYPHQLPPQLQQPQQHLSMYAISGPSHGPHGLLPQHPHAFLGNTQASPSFSPQSQSLSPPHMMLQPSYLMMSQNLLQPLPHSQPGNGSELLGQMRSSGNGIGGGGAADHSPSQQSQQSGGGVAYNNAGRTNTGNITGGEENPHTAAQMLEKLLHAATAAAFDGDASSEGNEGETTLSESGSSERPSAVPEHAHDVLSSSVQNLLN